MSENVKIIEKFINNNVDNVIFGINVDEETSLFYKYFIKKILSKNGILLKEIDDINDISEKSIDLFQNNNIYYISFKKGNYNVKKKLINFLPYRDVKKYMGNRLINTYKIDEDIKFIIKYYKFENENKLFDYLRSKPYMIETEIEKLILNKKKFNFVSSDNNRENIFFVRKKIFEIKRRGFELKKLYQLIKKETILKKFNFLIY